MTLGKEAVIKITGFKKYFKSNIIGPFDFTVTKGKMHAIIGTSGSGKTVLIKTLVGGYPQYEGFISILDKKLTKMSVKSNIGYVPEFITFPENISAYKYLKFMGKANGLSGKILKERIKELMSSLGLWIDRNKKLSQFSSGMKKRIMIIQGIIHDPKIIILDEPEAGLDIHNRRKIIKYLKQLTLQGKTVFLSSHLIDELKDYIDEYTFILNGKQIYTGDIKELNINKSYYLTCDNVKKMITYFKENDIAKRFDNDTKHIVFMINSPMQLQDIIKYAEKNNINISKIAASEFSFEYLIKQLAYNMSKNKS